jgi:translation initiation factor IF-2
MIKKAKTTTKEATKPRAKATAKSPAKKASTKTTKSTVKIKEIVQEVQMIEPKVVESPVLAPKSTPAPVSVPVPAPKPVWNRPPVVVVLGHVDHGKSSLLEAIKDFKITSKESGGITQHIGAYEVEHAGKKITFIDTPGHEAFSAMRLRGASVADVALLVVDAAQTVQPQTREAIATIKSAGIPMIAVLNKIDLPTANPQKIKGELLKADVVVESMGGEVPSVEVSAKEKIGIDELLEMISLIAEMQNLVSDREVPAEGLVIESYMDANKGPVATVIVEKGTLRLKDIIATDLAQAKVKSLLDFTGKAITEVLPSQPAIVLGFEKVPGVGEKFTSFKTAEEAEAKLKTQSQKKEIIYTSTPTESDKKLVNVIVKADVFGSLEAIDAMLKSLPSDKVILRILKIEVGDINENDVKLAETTGAEIIGFRVKINPGVMQIMKNDIQKNIRIKTFNVIYELVQALRNAMEKSLDTEVTRRDVGKLKAILVFWADGNRQIVGGKIIDGELKKGLKVDVMRDEIKVGAGRIINLQRNKKDAEKLVKGDEAGILFEGNVKIEEKDVVVAWVEERQKGIL